MINVRINLSAFPAYKVTGINHFRPNIFCKIAFGGNDKNALEGIDAYLQVIDYQSCCGIL